MNYADGRGNLRLGSLILDIVNGMLGQYLA